MPKKPLKFVQHKLTEHLTLHPCTRETVNAENALERPLLFVNRDGRSLQKARNPDEARAITAHVASLQRNRHRRQQKFEQCPTASRTFNKDEKVEDSETTVGANINLCGSCIHGKLRWMTPELNFIHSDCNFCPISVEMFKPLTSSSIIDFSMDPFSPVEVSMSPEVKNLLYLYFQIIYPFAKLLHHDWEWFDRIPEIQASPMLCYAIASYASIFFAGLRQGSKGVVLPPPITNDRSQPQLWPIPSWFRFQAMCLSNLKKSMKDITKSTSISVFHTVLFLLRISVLLGDGATARIHIKALATMSEIHLKDVELLRLESTVVKVNLISAYLHKPAIFTSDRGDETGYHTSREVQHNPEHWTDEKEWRKCRNMILGRLLIWRAEIPDASLEPFVRARIFDADVTAQKLDETNFSSLGQCYQLALYLWAYLIGISYESTMPKIRVHVLELQERLLALHMSRVWKLAPTTMFNILFAGAFATRAFAERAWFIEQISTGPKRMHNMHELHETLSNFTDPDHARSFLLEELLGEIIAASEGSMDSISRSTDLYLGQIPSRGQWPFTLTPDLTVPIEHITDE